MIRERPMPEDVPVTNQTAFSGRLIGDVREVFIVMDTTRRAWLIYGYDNLIELKLKLNLNDTRCLIVNRKYSLVLRIPGGLIYTSYHLGITNIMTALLINALAYLLPWHMS